MKLYYIEYLAIVGWIDNIYYINKSRTFNIKQYDIAK